MTTDNMQDVIDALHTRIDALAERLETSLSPSLNQIMWESIAHLDDQVQHNAQVRSCSYANLDALRARAATLEDVLARQSGRLQDLEKQVWAAGNEIEALLERQQAVENLVCAYRERLERLENNHQASLDNLARRLERAEKNLWPTVAVETTEPSTADLTWAFTTVSAEIDREQWIERQIDTLPEDQRQRVYAAARARNDR